MCTTGSEDAITVQAGTFSWDRNEKPVLEKCVWDAYPFVCVPIIPTLAFTAILL